MIIGYPVGLPVKIADGAKVKNLEKTYFTANLDSFGGKLSAPYLVQVPWPAQLSL